MPNNNPGGSNDYINSGGTEEPYGAIARRKVLTDMAPPGNDRVASAINTPQRSQRAAQKKKSRVTSNAAPPPVPPQEQGPQLSPLAQFWADLANEPGASDLVRTYAQQVAGV